MGQGKKSPNGFRCFQLIPIGDKVCFYRRDVSDSHCLQFCTATVARALLMTATVFLVQRTAVSKQIRTYLGK